MNCPKTAASGSHGWPAALEEDGMPVLTRRGFLKAGAAGALALGLGRLRWIVSPAAAKALAGSSYRDFGDLYRERWRWDRVVRGTHTNANCISSCAWNLYVRDGIVCCVGFCLGAAGSRGSRSHRRAATGRGVAEALARRRAAGADVDRLAAGLGRARVATTLAADHQTERSNENERENECPHLLASSKVTHSRGGRWVPNLLPSYLFGAWEPNLSGRRSQRPSCQTLEASPSIAKPPQTRQYRAGDPVPEGLDRVPTGALVCHRFITAALATPPIQRPRPTGG